jgi:hypothetical protein
METCSLGVNIDQPCNSDCKVYLAKKTADELADVHCFADKKFKLFLEERVTFGVGMSAFHQSNPTIIEDFFSKSNENKELITYFLYINEPNIVKSIIEEFTPATLAALFKSDFNSFKSINASAPRERKNKSIFKVKSYRYWTYVNFQKICDTIGYFIRVSKEPELASQFLIILPPNIVSNLREYTGFTPEEEIILYRALGDAIYELPIQTPKIYEHMLVLFADDMEIFMILSTMEELIKRQGQILDLTEKLLIYTEKNRIDLSIQFIYSELNGLDIGTASEILNQLLEKQMLTSSQKDMLLGFLKNGSLDMLKRLRDDLL